MREFSKNELEKLYIDDKLSTGGIAQKLGVSKTTIKNKLRLHNIPRRTNSEAQKLAKEHWRFRGEEHWSWCGGRYKTTSGYIFVKCPSHPYANSHGYVLEHRLVMEKRLGHSLMPWEKVHHIDGIRDNNEDSNLQLLSPREHLLKEKFCKGCPIRKRLLRIKKELDAVLQLKLEGEE